MHSAFGLKNSLTHPVSLPGRLYSRNQGAEPSVWAWHLLLSLCQFSGSCHLSALVLAPHHFHFIEMGFNVWWVRGRENTVQENIQCYDKSESSNTCSNKVLNHKYVFECCEVLVPTNHDAHKFFLVVSMVCRSSFSDSATLLEILNRDRFWSVSSDTRSSSCWGLVKYSSGSSCRGQGEGEQDREHVNISSKNGCNITRFCQRTTLPQNLSCHCQVYRLLFWKA